MLSNILLIAISNVIAGRWKDVFGIPDDKDVKGGRLVTLFFRCVIPALVLYSLGGWCIGLATLIGMLAWAAPGWSFDEITGQFDSNKYPTIIRKIGLYFVPVAGTGEEPSVVSATNKLRGVIMKGIRGAYILPAFAMFTAVNPYALLWWLGSFSMGICYWIGGSSKSKYAVMVGEFITGFLFSILLINGAGL